MADKLYKTLALDDSVKQNKRGEAILGKLYGPCADIIHSTRNGRKYPEEVWEKVFNNEIINEFFEAGGLLGELDHPADRIDTCTEKVAICMPEKPTKDKDGHLVASFDILDTPNGRIAYTLAKYGYKLGISSRGDGEVFEDYNGEEVVDADTFDLRGFDLVLLPAVKAARLQMVESLQKPFKQALTEALNKSNEDERRVQLETLSHLGIVTEEIDKENKEENKPATADNVGVEMVEQLQEALKRNGELEKKVQELQEKLSVCYAKEIKLQEDLERFKSTTISLSKSAKTAKDLNTSNIQLRKQLSESLATSTKSADRVAELEKADQNNRARIQSLQESLKTSAENVTRLKESLMSSRKKALAERKALEENLAEVKQNASIKNTEYTAKLSKANQLVEHYRNVASIAVNRYIAAKAKSIGVTVAEIKNKLTENYSFSDIDRACENLRGYQVNVSKLPFSVDSSRNSKVRVKVTEAIEPIKKPSSEFDDEVDESLLSLTGLKEDSDL